MYSKNDVFTTDWSVKPPPSIIIKPLTQKQQQPTIEIATRTAAPVKTHEYTNEEYAASDQVLDPPSESDGLEVKLSLQNGELGHGRHASVYLALYRDTSSSNSRDILSNAQTNQWKLCAAKRFIPGKEAQVACFSEAAMLSRLSRCSQILHYIGLKDERPISRPSSSRSSSASGFPAEEDKGDESIGSSSMNTKDFPDRRSPSRTRSSTSQSTPSSPVTLPSTNKDDLSIPPLIGLQRSAIEDNGKASSYSGLRRNATVKAPKSPSRLGHSTRKGLTISTLSLGEETPRMLLLTEYCHLGNLATFVKDHGQQVLGINMFFKFAIDLMKAVVAVHDRNIIHGDIKPQNCMIDSAFNLKLGDFSSSLFNSPDLVDGIGLGTTQYSSPEVVRMPPSPFSFPVDIFSAGLTMLFMITGVQPYEALTMSSGNRSDRFTPISPHSPRNTPGNVTPTFAHTTSRRKYRTSSGAGKMVELHVHLSKGHAWEWEERRRLEELEYTDMDRQDQSYSDTVNGDTNAHYIHLPRFDMSDTGLTSLKPPDDYVTVPENLIDPIFENRKSKGIRTYSDGYTPVQYFLANAAPVPEKLRHLIKQMLDPVASERPTAYEALQELKSLAANG